jgi:hypothetical protein
MLAAEIERATGIVKRSAPPAPAWHAAARRMLLWWLRRGRGGSRAAVDATVVATSMSLRPVRTALEEMQQSTAPVFVGPWMDSVGNELLYWVPFVRWAAATYGLPPERLIVVSGGGARDWYGNLAQRHLDAHTLFSPAELEHWAHRTVPQSEQDPKQAVMSPFDQEILERAARAFELSEHQVLHPLMFFRTMRRVQQDRTLPRLSEVLRHVRVSPGVSKASDSRQLPRSYVAVSVAFTDALPASDENQRVLSELLAQLAAEHEVVIADAVPPAEVPVPQGGRVHHLQTFVEGADVAQAQTQVMAHAKAFIGSHGDLAVLAASCGIPTTTYHSERLPVDQMERLQSAASAGWGAVTVERARRFKGLRMALRA